VPPIAVYSLSTGRGGAKSTSCTLAGRIRQIYNVLNDIKEVIYLNDVIRVNGFIDII
jgi:hypothetical protein